MTETMSPATEAMTIITAADVPRDEKDPIYRVHTFARALDHLSAAQEVQIYGDEENRNIVRFGGDL